MGRPDGTQPVRRHAETGKRVGEVVTLGLIRSWSTRQEHPVSSTGTTRAHATPLSPSATSPPRLSATSSGSSPGVTGLAVAVPPAREQRRPQPDFTTDLFCKRLNRWLRVCEVKDATGSAVTVSSHQFRHTLATRILNMGVPQHILQQMLGHVGADTVATYVD